VVEGDDHCEAYTTIVWGRLLSRERYYAAEAEAVDIAEGNMCGPAMRGSIAQPWSMSRCTQIADWHPNVFNACP
jgi:hypothetical protein